MSCQCYQIGGPFISEDPDCPVHGVSAQDRNQRAENALEIIAQETDIEKMRKLSLNTIRVLIDLS